MHFTPFPEFPGGITLHEVVLRGSLCNGTSFIDSFSCLYLFPLLYLCSLHLPNTPLELQSFSQGLLLERASQLRLVVKNPPANAGDTRGGFDSWVGKIPKRRKWQPTPVFLPGEPHGQRNLADYSPKFYGPWGHNESEMTEHAHASGRT